MPLALTSGLLTLTSTTEGLPALLTPQGARLPITPQ